MVGGDYVSPWERGRRASTVRTEALNGLGDDLWKFAEVCGKLADQDGARRSLKVDAQCMVQMMPCRNWITDVCEARANLTDADAEAALLSAYVEVMTTARRRLFAAYQSWVASRLEKPLYLAMKMIRLDLSADLRREQVLKPMACFFLESLRTLESNPNRFGVHVGRGHLAVRPFGWSPTHDDLDIFLSLLITRQVKGRYWSKALKYSPFAYYLRSEALAAIGDVERYICECCGKEFFERSVLDCPECGGPIVRTDAKYLLFECHPEAHFDRISRTGEEGSPEFTVERAERHRKALDIATGRTLELWKGTVEKPHKNYGKIAILLSLAALEDVPDLEELSRPRNEWLERIVERHFDGSLRSDVIAERARLLLPRLLAAFGIARRVGLSDENARTIISRVKACIFD